MTPISKADFGKAAKVRIWKIRFTVEIHFQKILFMDSLKFN